jgi:uncharacterized protein (TIGR03435 family)
MDNATEDRSIIKLNGSLTFGYSHARRVNVSPRVSTPTIVILIMTARTLKFRLTLALLCVVALDSLSPQRVLAQTPTFEVASVKAHKGEGGTTRVTEPGSIRYLNITLGEFIIIAFGVKRYQIAGPDWVVSSESSDRYDIVAKAGESVHRDQVPRLIGPLLAERFKLQFHRETRELPVFALTVLKGGPKFKEGDGGESSADPDGKGGISFKNYPMSALAVLLTNTPAVGRAVVDRTGLNGKYSFTANLLDVPVGAPIDELEVKMRLGADGDPVSSPILSNLQGQLGLKLEAIRAPIEMIVIDHAEKMPTGD